jgi:hypothetical protein
MKKELYYAGVAWPDTGRTWPMGARLEVHFLSEKWMDLVWLNGNGQWQYISTLP